MNFGQKVALITGGSSGIGADAARHLAKFGAQVSIVGRNHDRLNDVAEQIEKSGAPTPLPIVADVKKEADRIVDETIKHFGQLDILINNAGVGYTDNICSVDIRKYVETFDTNVRSVLTLTKLCVPHLEKTKGNIVNVSSSVGIKPLTNMLSYSMSKGALSQLTKCCALDLASKGIRVNAINPSAVRTPKLEALGFTPEQIEEVGKHVFLIGRVGEVSDTSAAIAFLACEQTASFLTGILLPVDGGFMTSH